MHERDRAGNRVTRFGDHAGCQRIPTESGADSDRLADRERRKDAVKRPCQQAACDCRDRKEDDFDADVLEVLHDGPGKSHVKAYQSKQDTDTDRQPSSGHFLKYRKIREETRDQEISSEHTGDDKP